MNNDSNPEQSGRILVVDDATANLQLLTNLLTEHGYVVHPASDGELALEFVQTTLPELVLLDIRMPELDGYEVCRRLKADERTASIPVIFISILEDERDKVKGFQLGAVDYITKPFQPEEVLARVGTHLRLRELTERLEQKVSERTAELMLATQRLEREIAERKKVEEALRESEEKYRIVADNTHDWEFWLNPEDKFIYNSPSCERITGYAPERFLADPGLLERIVHPDDRSRLAEHLQTAKRMAYGMLEYRIIRSEGRITWIEHTCQPVFDEKGNFLGTRGSNRDITERKVAEQDIALLNFALDNVGEAAYLIDERARFHFVNDESCRVLGYTRTELLGLGVPDVDPDLPVERWPGHWQELKKRHSLSFESRHRTRAGHIFPVEINANYFEYGGVAYNLALVRDITDRKRAEEKLFRLNRELKAISNCNQAMLKAEDEQTLLNDICRIICNEAGYRLAWVGYAEDDAAKTVRSVAWAGVEDGYLTAAGITWNDTERGRGPTGTAIRTGQSVCIQDFATDPNAAPWRDGALIRGYRSSLALPLMTENNTPFGALNIYSAEPNVFTAEEIRLLEELAGDLALGIMVLRARIERRRTESIRRARLRLLDKAYASDMNLDDMLRLMLDEIEAHTGSSIGFYHFLEEDQQTLSLQNWSTNTLTTMCTSESKGRHYPVSESGVWVDCVREKRPVIHNDYASLPHRKGTPPGHAPLIRELLVPVMRGDLIVAIIGVGNKPEDYNSTDVQIASLLGDVSWEIVKRKRTEESLRRLTEELEQRVRERTSELEQANSKLQDLDRLKSMFIASMSHELRTPLNSIIGFSSILLQEWIGAIAPEQKEKLTIILRSGKHLLNLVNDVIDVSKIEAGKLETAIEDFDLFDLVEEANSLFKNDIVNKGLALEVAAIHQNMHTDRRRLLQCVLNFISNAVKFTEKGKITLEAGVIPAAEEAGPPRGLPTGDFVQISVADTGIGIREEDMAKLFHAFVRIPSPLAARVKGTGLGLYLAKKIAVEILKGEISVNSRFGQGSIFTLRVPVAI